MNAQQWIVDFSTRQRSCPDASIAALSRARHFAAAERLCYNVVALHFRTRFSDDNLRRISYFGAARAAK